MCGLKSMAQTLMEEFLQHFTFGIIKKLIGLT